MVVARLKIDAGHVALGQTTQAVNVGIWIVRVWRIRISRIGIITANITPYHIVVSTSDKYEHSHQGRKEKVLFHVYFPRE